MTSRVIYCFLLIVVSVNCVDFGRLLLIRRPPSLKVGIGQSTFLTNRHLVIQQKVKNGDVCRVEVDDNEPTSLMVGRLEPKKFDCFFKDTDVRYQHEGSPLTAKDQIKFMVYYFWRNNSVVESVTVNVAIDLKPNYKIFDLRSDLIVKTSKAITSPISSNVLRFRYNPEIETCTVSYATIRARARRGDRGLWMATRKWPAIGRVVDYHKKVVISFKHDCQEMIIKGYRYEHRKPGSPNIDFIPLSVRVQRKGAGPPFSERREYLFLKMVIKNAAPNVPPKLSVNSVKLTNLGGIIEPLPKKAITIEKDESRNRFLIVNVTSLNFNVPGRLVNKRDLSKSITSFTYSDFKEGKIYFQILRHTDDHLKEYVIGLQAIDGYLAKSNIQFLTIKSYLMKGHICQYFETPVITYTKSATLVKDRHLQALSCKTRALFHFSLMGTGNGEVTVKGLPLSTFTKSDINASLVVYKHRNFGEESDYISVKGKYSNQTVRLLVPVHIVKLHDRQAMLRAAKSKWKVEPRGFTCFTDQMIKKGASQLLFRDNVNLKFNIIKHPTHGFLVRSVGTPPFIAPKEKINSFTYKDLLLGRFCYRHTGWERDEFTVAQESELDIVRLQAVTVRIVSKKPPTSKITKMMNPNDTLEVTENANSIKLTPRHLLYGVATGKNFITRDIEYRITMFPHFTNATETVDAGRLISVKDLVRTGHTGDMQITSVVKDLKKAQIGTVTNFTQTQVDSGDIVYVPPLNDIGISDREVVLNFTVSTRLGHRMPRQQLLIRVKAKDDKAPIIQLKIIDVKRGSTYILKSDDIKVSDIDTPLSKVMVEVKKLPMHGKLKDEKGREMLTGYRFPATAISEKKIKYVNNGKNFQEDSFNVTVSDGPRTSKVFTVHLNISNYDWNIGAWKAYVNNSIQVKENSSQVIREAVFPMPVAKEMPASDADILYYVLERPVKGQIMRGNGAVSQFTLRDVRQNLIRYNHTLGEIGPQTVYDFARVIMHLKGERRGYRKVNFSIIPINSQPPRIFVSSSLIVLEGRKDANSIIGYNVLAAVDRDTHERNIRIRVINKPVWGQIMVNGKEAYDFSMAQIREGRVTYVQSKNSKGVEETQDQFSITASDGKFLSKNHKVSVSIIPVNDEKPQLRLKDFIVDRGGKQPLDDSVFSVTDADIPKDNLQIRISKLPREGDLVIYWNGGDKQKVTRYRNLFSRHYLKIMQLVYEQRNSSKKFKDSFEVTVSDGVHKVKKTCFIRITGENRLPPLLLASKPLIIESAVTGRVTKAQLNAIDADTPPASLTYTLVKSPAHGEIVRIGDEVNLAPRSRLRSKSRNGGTFRPQIPIFKGKTFTQEDVNLGKITYMYLGKPKDRVDDDWMVRLTDGKVILAPRLIKVICSNPPRTVPLSMKTLLVRVNRDGAVTLTPRDITIQNSVTPVDRLKIEVSQMARCGLLVDTKMEKRVSLTSFLYNELHDQRIVFSVKDCPTETKELAIGLVVKDMSSRAETLLRIKILSQPPVVKRFLPLVVKQKSREVIGPEILSTEDPDTPPTEIVYKLETPPLYGVLVRGTQEIMRNETFSQQDVNQRKINYVNIQPSPNGRDSIAITVTDGDHTTYGFAGRLARRGSIDFPIIIKPVAQKLVLVDNTVPTTLTSLAPFGFGFRFGKENIRSNYPNVTRYIIRRNPMFGRLRIDNGGRGDVNSFTSDDLNRKILLYTMKPRGKIFTNDSFEFNLEVRRDVRTMQQFANNSYIYRMDLYWAKILFTKKRYRICEKPGVLKIRIIREGSLKSKIAVRISITSKGARSPRDFLPSSNSEIVFERGQKESIYEVIIKEGSNRRERKSKSKKRKRFVISLKSATNALIGETSKAIVVIKDGKKCRWDADFISPKQAGEETRRKKQRKEMSYLQREDERQMLQDIQIPSDEELRRQMLRQHETLIPDLPSSEELRKYEQHYVSIKDLSQAPQKNAPNQPCELMDNGITTQYKGKQFICDGVNEKWIPLEQVNKRIPMCEKGWTLNNDKCYRYFDVRLPWIGAKESCERHKSILAAPTTMEKQKWITEKISRKRKFWIGLHYDLRKDLWMYTDYSRPNFTRWNRKRPSIRHLRRKRGSRRCIMVSPVFTWCPRRCSGLKHRFGFVCEKAAK